MTHGEHSSRARIDEAQSTVLASGGEKTTVATPAQRLHEVAVAEDDANGLGLLQIPQHDLTVGAGAQHDVLGRRMPLDLAHFALMAVQVDEPVGEILGEAVLVVADLPHLDGGVLGARGDLVVVERIPLEVEDGAAVPAHLGRVHVHAARVTYGHDEERAATALFGHHGHELGVDGAERRVVRGILRYFDILVAVVLLVSAAVHVPELGRTYLERHRAEQRWCFRVLVVVVVVVVVVRILLCVRILFTNELERNPKITNIIARNKYI